MLNIAGWSKMSTVDWPGEIVATLFLQGCPLKCNYCHNYQILDPSIKGEISFENDVIPFLKTRVGLLDGVVFSGGEPLMQGTEKDDRDSETESDLFQAMKTVKDMGFKIGLHTSGIYPDNLKNIANMLDWVGFDIKAKTGQYDLITNVRGSELNCRKSLNYLLELQEFRKNTENPLKIQFRTTVDPTVMTKNDVKQLQTELKEKGIDNLILQEVRAIGAREEYAKRLAEVSTQNSTNNLVNNLVK